MQSTESAVKALIQSRAKSAERLAESYGILAVSTLRESCRNAGLPTSGTKAELIERLVSVYY